MAALRGVLRAVALAFCVVEVAVEAALLRHRTPSASLLSQAGEGRGAAGVCAAGEPTDFAYSGCVKTSKLHDEVRYTGSRQVTVKDCFGFCQKKKGQQYFGVAKGNQCWCASLHEGSRVDFSKCDSPCAGNKNQMCGGIDTASVYVMFDCTAPTKEEIAEEAAKKEEEVMTSYSALDHQSCGQAADNKATINGGVTMIGSIDECKMACSKGTGAMECHGFTFEDDLSKCTFHYDVLDGEIKKSKKSKCLFKMLGF